MMKISAAVLSLITLARADIVYENEPIVASEVFDLKFAYNSKVGTGLRNNTKYYCVYRSLWNKQNHPVDYPEKPRISPQVIFSHTKQYTPFLKNREANRGVEVLVEVRCRCFSPCPPVCFFLGISFFNVFLLRRIV